MAEDLTRPYVGYRSAGRRPERAQDRRAAADAPLAALRGMVSGVLGAPGDVESLVRLLPGLSEETLLPTSEDIERRLPLRVVSQTPAGRAFTTAGQLGGGGYMGPGSPLRAVAALPSAVRRAGRDFAVAAGQPAVNVVKPKGGNWLQGSIEQAIGPMRVRERTPGVNLHTEEDALRDRSLNTWLDKKLRNYIRNEMATPEDPIRALAERGVSHYEMRPLADYNLDNVEGVRMDAGFPAQGMATTRLGREWEAAADRAIYPSQAGYLARTKEVDTNPFLLKVPPETTVYEVGPRQSQFERLGFSHLVDELRNAINPASGLPRELLWKYSDLEKVTVPQAVERVAKINEWRAAQKAEADLARAQNAATFTHKEYPEAGFRWVELKTGDLPEGWERRGPKGVIHGPEGQIGVHPGEKALADALKYEGETMGHCVGGYCPDVLEGRSRIFSLRDRKGQPHVTIEVNPSSQRVAPRHEEVLAEMKASGLDASQLNEAAYDAAYEQALQRVKQKRPPEIIQIKGKANRAPKEEYLPFVQDFVRSQQWGRVGDLENAGLRRIDPQSDLGARLREVGVEIPPYVSESELTGLLDRYGRTTLPPSPEGFAAGGLVKGAVKSLGDLLDKYVAKGAPLVRKYGRDEAVAALEESQKANLQHQPLLESLHRHHADENPRIADIIEGMYDDLERGVDTGAAARAYDEGYRLPGARLSFGKDIAVRSPRAWTPGLHFAAPGNEAQLAPLIERYFSEFGPRSRSLSPVARPVLARADRPIQLPDLAFEDPALLASKLGLSAEFRAALRNKPDASTAEKSQVITQMLARRGVDLGAYTNEVEGQLGAGNTSYVSFGKNKIRGFATGGAVAQPAQIAAVPYDEAKIDALATALTA